MSAVYTDITILLDRSASMHSIKVAMESALDEFVLQHRAIPSSRLTLAQFDDINSFDPVFTARPIGEVGRIQIDPRGNTPLLDALCVAIDTTGDRLAAMPETARPDRVLFVIITDGQENASKRMSRADVAARVTRQTRDYGWQFVYLGANQDAFAEAASFGINAGQTLNYAATAGGTRRATTATVTNTVAYASRTSNAVPDFSDSQRDEAACPDDDDLGNTTASSSTT